MITRKDTLKYLRKQCYSFTDGVELFNRAKKQIKSSELYFENNKDFDLNSLEFSNLINATLSWAETDEGSNFWARRCLTLCRSLTMHKGTSKLPNNAKPLFVEIEEC